MTDAAAPKPRRTLRLALAALVLVLLAALVLLYGTRRIIAREALTGWLQARGIASEAEIQGLGLTGATARLRIGDPRNPEFTAERAEVRYALRGFSLEVSSVRLVRPVLRASLRGGKLSAGSLDPLIEEFRRQPPKPDARKPRIEVDDGVLLLATDFGPLRLMADALVNDGRLVRLAGGAAPARLAGRDFALETAQAALDVSSRQDRAFVRLDAPVAAGRFGDAAIAGARLRLTAETPYPDLEKKRGEGGVVLRLDLTGRELRLPGQSLSDAHLAGVFTGETRGWIPDLAVRGGATATLRASGASLAAGRSGALRASLAATDVAWTRRGGDAVAARLRLSGSADDLAASELKMTRLAVRAEGPVAWRGGRTSLRLAGGVEGQGGWSGLGAPVAEDSREIAAVKRGLRNFRVSAPGLQLASEGGPPSLRLTQAARLVPATGGEVRLSPQGGGWRLAVAGGGLPKVDADVARVRLANGGAVAEGRVRAALSLGPLERGSYDAAGRLEMAGGAVRFVAARCAVVRVAHVELGENDVKDVAGRFCPTAGQPLLSLSAGDWRIAGHAQGASAAAPFLQAQVSDASARVVMGLARGRLHATAAISGATVTDAAPATRFHPLRMTGRAILARDVWTSDLAFATPAGQPVAAARLRHDVPAVRGGVEIDTGELVFAEGALQPVQLSPLAEAVGSPATGRARFTGRFGWTAEGATSAGTLQIPSLDFVSPAGRVSGLSGHVVFTSLAPLIAAPGQQLSVAAVDGPFPLAGVTATFGLEKTGLVISGGEAAVGGGRVTIEAVRVPLTADQPVQGVLNLEGVQLHDIVEASPFGDKVEFDAKVSGRMPFEVSGQRVRILGGSLRAIQPGRISIQRTAITGVAASTEVAAPPGVPAAPEASTDTFTDFAYQAMENLAFDTLEATVASREDGRLGVLFHIVGRHDPPQHQEIRLGIVDLIRRNFMNRKLPLPSGTGVNLTLDTTLNLDDLLRDYGEYQRLRSSPPVQP
ncbi:intermembrane phospholipid transport protein YdbH family protein [Phenylobacterium sp.]|uniref:intermembrane phospholipid transport protein YdbH family protein n=1 Tax=Phenylobacterium sp. TaxID=1871053 RepID=UPI002F9263A2